MYLEAFTAAKDPGHPARNEDRLVCYDGRSFAVVDGVTDKSGSLLPDGRSRGQAAGQLIERVLRDVTDAGEAMTAPAAELLERFAAAFLAAYDRLGIREEAMARPELRFGAQLALAVNDRDSWRLLVVGDCGIRVDQGTILQRSNEADRLLARARALVFHHVLARGVPVTRALDVARAYTVHGMGACLGEHADAVSREDHARLRQRAIAEARSAHPELPDHLIESAIETGLLGVGRLRNAPGPLGHACIDGSDVPPSFVLERRLERSEVRSIELFSDGYFGAPPAGAAGAERAAPAAGPSVGDWERHFAHVERDDPFKVGPFASTKGSPPGRFTDDRTVLVLRPRGPGETGEARHAG